jgi:UDP-2-acetamido-3-amino-2,3-dideoxy-glucuronate N-acetyltransferase
MEKRYFVHPTALVDDPVEIGDKTQIWHFSHIMGGKNSTGVRLIEGPVLSGVDG